MRRASPHVKAPSELLWAAIHKHADMLPRMNTAEAGFALVHEDESLVVVDKPAGLLSVPGRGEGVHHNLTTLVQARWAEARVVHRLDQATSGLIAFGLGADAQRALSVAFAERRVYKRYEAVVHGEVASDEGDVALPLMVDWPNRPRQIVDLARGKPALTRWRVVARRSTRTHLLLEPVTGRSHQLRVHMQALGHAIIGDELYGPQPPQADRLLLHAAELHLPHPARHEVLRLKSEVPFTLSYSESQPLQEPRPSCT